MTEPTSEHLTAADQGSPVLASGLPFAFAQSRNVLFERSGSSLTLHYVPPLTTDVLLEVRRYVGEGFSLEPLEEEAFRQRLTRRLSAHPERSCTDGRGSLHGY